MTRTEKFWAIVPAAGTGKRMMSNIPKQYLTVGGKTILELTLQKLSAIPLIEGIVVAVAESDCYHLALNYIPDNVVWIKGGEERADSVLKGLEYLKKQGHSNDWAVVHDAARPCVSQQSIETLLRTVATKKRGGILAAPVSDTLKQVSGMEIQKTLDRSNLWHAHTPQVFCVWQLFDAITASIANGADVTDEASAMEYIGEYPLIIPDSRNNLKVTHPEDLNLVELILLSGRPAIRN